MSTAPRLRSKYRIQVATSVKLPAESLKDLASIQASLRMASSDPTREVSQSTAIRRALAVYSVICYHLNGKLAKEADHATDSTYLKDKSEFTTTTTTRRRKKGQR